MTMISDVIPKPIFRVLTQMTHQPRIDVALSVAVKDWIRLKLKEVDEERSTYEQKYGMNFEEFKQKMHADLIPDSYSYEVEKDYWEWEATTTDAAFLRELEAYYNEQTDTAAYALVQNGIRTFGADNATGWHYHPFENPALHIPLKTEMKFAEFLGEVERRLS